MEILIKLITLIIIFLFEVVFIFKCAKIGTHLYYPNWKFDRSLIVEPVIKVKSYKLSWVLTILLMPLIIGLTFLVRSPTYFIDYARTFSKVAVALAMLALIYFISILLLFAALLERELPRRVYKKRKELWIDFTIYGILGLILLVCSLYILP